MSALYNNGDGSFQAPVNYSTGNGSISAAIGDFNGDGAPDLAVANFNGGCPSTISVLLNNGSGTFGSAVNYTAGSGPEAVVTADFTGDGVLDLAVANGPSNNVSVFVGNGDGSLDLATANNMSNDISILINANDWSLVPQVANLPADMLGQSAAMTSLPGTAAPAAGIHSERLAAPVANLAGTDAVPQVGTSERKLLVTTRSLDPLAGGLAVNPLANDLWSLGS